MEDTSPTTSFFCIGAASASTTMSEPTRHAKRSVVGPTHACEWRDTCIVPSCIVLFAGMPRSVSHCRCKHGLDCERLVPHSSVLLLQDKGRCGSRADKKIVQGHSRDCSFSEHCRGSHIGRDAAIRQPLQELPIPVGSVRRHRFGLASSPFRETGEHVLCGHCFLAHPR